MLELAYFILACFGMTQVIVYGKIFNKIRPTEGWFGDLFSCTMCTGFWVGLFLWALNPFTELFTFDLSIVTGFSLGLISSGASYVISTCFDDEGIRLN